MCAKQYKEVGEELSRSKDRKVTVLDTVESTNTELLYKLRRGETEPALIAAKKQSAGRGRRGRTFLSDGGGVYFSFNTSVPLSDAEYVGCITPLAGVSAVLAIENSFGIKVGLKWVNDLILNGKKLGGILSESTVAGDRIHIVVGIGINIIKTPLPDIATCLFDSDVTECDANELILKVVSEFEKRLPYLRTIADEYRRHLYHVGGDVTVHTFDGADDYEAVMLGVNEKCELTVRTPDGELRTLSSGEVSIKLN